MAENVFILGAGASAESGAPLMDNFLDVPEDLFREKAFGEFTVEIGKIFKLINTLGKVYAKSYLNLSNIESGIKASKLCEDCPACRGRLPMETLQQFQKLIFC